MVTHDAIILYFPPMTSVTKRMFLPTQIVLEAIPNDLSHEVPSLFPLVYNKMK